MTLPWYPRRLEGRRIRLLKIDPSEDLGQVTCHLNEYDIGSCPAYEALSYVWGNPGLRTNIICNGERFWVTLNIARALRRLRLRDAPRLVWADAVCINQDDLEERSQQVQRMRSIFASAKRVVVWLGEDFVGESTYKALGLIQAVVGACEEYASLLNSTAKEECRKRSGLVPVTLNNVKTLAEKRLLWPGQGWQVLRYIYSRAWFERAWCVQEVIVATDRLVLVGDYSVSWDDPGICASWVWWQGLAVEFDLPSDFNGISHYNAYAMYHPFKLGTSLFGVLMYYRGFKTTDPRDQVYALLGLCEDGQQPLTVDYEKSIAEVYIEVASVAVGMLGETNLRLLSSVQHLPEYTKSEFPSWVTRWDKEILTVTLDHSAETWRACGTHFRQLTRQVQSGTLIVQGIIVDTVAFTSEMMDEHLFKGNNVDEYSNHTFLDIWQQCSQGSDSQKSTARMARTLSCGHTGGFKVIEELDEEELKAYYSSFYAYIQRLIGYAGARYSITVDPRHFHHGQGTGKITNRQRRGCAPRGVSSGRRAATTASVQAACFQAI